MIKQILPHPANPLSNKNLQFLKISKLQAYDGNARKHPQRQIDKLAQSIRSYGFIIPILIDAKNCIITGHARIEAAKKIGITEVPIIRIDHLTNLQIRAFRIADNRLAELAEWDEKFLKTELIYLIEINTKLEIDLDISIGFETAEIDNILNADTGEIDDIINKLEISEEKTSVTQLGDLWHLGKHKLLCANSCDPASYQKIMQKQKAQILCTDPPYNLPIDGFVSGKGSVKHQEFKQASGEMSQDQFKQFLKSTVMNAINASKDGALFYIFMDWRHDQELQEAAKQSGLTQVNLAVWDKNSGGMGSLYRSQHELVFIYKRDRAPHINNIMLGKYGRNRTNVWRHPAANMSKEGRLALKGHPTPKPIALIMDIIKDSTKFNDIVLEPFVGSGTTILAAEKTRRRCYGIELEPAYVDLTIERWETLSGQKAIHAETQMSYSERREGVKTREKIRNRNRRIENG